MSRFVTADEIESVTAHEVINMDILADETINLEVSWVPMGTARRFNIKFAVNNPVSSGSTA